LTLLSRSVNVLTEARLARAAGLLRSAIAKTFPDQFSALAEAAMVYAVVASERQFVLYGQMSALGHEQTSRHVRVMSVIPLKADIRQRGLRVRLVPQADILLFFYRRSSSSDRAPREGACHN